MMSHDDIERRNEANEGVHLPNMYAHDEEGRFSVRTVFLDGVERTHSTWTSLRNALAKADEERARLHKMNYDRHRVHVDVVDEDDPERGSLDWEDVN